METWEHELIHQDKQRNPVPAGLSNPMTTAGDIIYSSDGSGTPARLALGTNEYVLTVDTGTQLPKWKVAAAGGGVASKAGGMYRHAAYQFANSALTLFPFDTVMPNFDNTNVTIGTSRYTADVAGVYHYSAHITADAATANLGLRLYKNGAFARLGIVVGTVIGVNITGEIYLALNDYIQIYYFAGAANNLDLTNYGTADGPSAFTVFRVA